MSLFRGLQLRKVILHTFVSSLKILIDKTYTHEIKQPNRTKYIKAIYGYISDKLQN